MAPYGACEVAQSTARSNAQIEAERLRKLDFDRKVDGNQCARAVISSEQSNNKYARAANLSEK